MTRRVGIEDVDVVRAVVSKSLLVMIAEKVIGVEPKAVDAIRRDDSPTGGGEGGVELGSWSFGDCALVSVEAESAREHCQDPGWP